MDSGWSIARESSELAYGWDSERVGKTEIFYDRNRVESN